MKLSTVRLGQDRTSAARLQKKHCVLLPYRDVGALIASGDGWRERAAADTGQLHRLDDITYAPLLVRPNRIVRVGPNYASRVRELGRPSPTVPEFSVPDGGPAVGSDGEICLAAEGQDEQWGVELGVVIGRRARDVTAESALSHVAGYTVVGHVCVRNSPESGAVSGPSAVPVVMGPTLVTTDDAPPGGRGLTMNSMVDGRVTQKANTSELIFDVATIIAHVSMTVTLLPGDLITTGTPAGAGTGRDSGAWTRTGTEVVGAIKGVCELRNTVVRSSAQ